MQKFFCSFADSRMNTALMRVKLQAEMSGLFDQVFCYDEFDLDECFVEKHKYLLMPNIRGFGYWIWKPQVVLQTLKYMNDGDILIYADAGCHINGKGKNVYLQYIKEVTNSSSDFLVFASKKGLLEREYTKGDILNFFKVQGNSYIVDTPQIHATTFLMRKTDKSVSIVKEWLNTMSNNINLVDDSVSETDNHVDFIENRHDQSIFSILMKLNKVKVYSIMYIWSYTWFFSKIFPILAKRDRGQIDDNMRHSLKEYFMDCYFCIRSFVWSKCFINGISL